MSKPMRTRSVILLILGCVFFQLSCFAKEDSNMLYSGISKDELIGKYSRQHGPVDVTELSYAEASFLAIVVDVSSGVARKSLYLYEREESKLPWILIAYRSSNSSSICVETNAEGITAVSKNGKKLLCISKDALSLKHDGLEQ